MNSLLLLRILFLFLSVSLLLLTIGNAAFAQIVECNLFTLFSDARASFWFLINESFPCFNFPSRTSYYYFFLIFVYSPDDYSPNSINFKVVFLIKKKRLMVWQNLNWCFLFFQVSWIRKRDLHILTVGILTYTNDQRYQSLHSDGSDEWTLKISSPQIRDSGTYECQVSTEPKISQAFRLSVVGKCIFGKINLREGNNN